MTPTNPYTKFRYAIINCKTSYITVEAVTGRVDCGAAFGTLEVLFGSCKIQMFSVNKCIFNINNDTGMVALVLA